MSEPLVARIEDEGWDTPRKILVILAHPDDPDFFCGASIARWCQMGHQVSYFLLTKGQRGFPKRETTMEEVVFIRGTEQLDAVDVLGVWKVEFSRFMDGELVADLDVRNEIIRKIRIKKPDIVVTSDPLTLFPAENRINHPDHRAAGQAVVDAIFPAAGNLRYLVKDSDGTPLEPHQVKELWITLTTSPTVALPVSEYLEKKLDAIGCHKSQIPWTRAELTQRFQERLERNPVTGEPEFLEKFRRIVFQ